MHQITDTEIYRNASPCREVSPTEDELIVQYKKCAYEDYEALIELGGRPTREVLEYPACTAADENDGVRIVAIQDDLDGNVALDKQLMVQHWSKESVCFDDELTRWKEFKLYQEKYPWSKIDFDPDATDPQLANILVKLNDWREFQRYQQMKIGGYALSIRKIMENPEDIVHDETVSAEGASYPNLQYLTGRSRDRFFELQLALESSEALLTWIEGQIPEILAETSATLEASPLLQRQLETELEQEAHAFHQDLLSLEAIPDRSVQTPSQSLRFTERVCHWGLETTRLMKNLWEWRVLKGQAAIISEDIDSIRVPVDDDICMADTCEAIDSRDTVAEGADTASVDDSTSDDEDDADRGQRGWIRVPDV